MLLLRCSWSAVERQGRGESGDCAGFVGDGDLTAGRDHNGFANGETEAAVAVGAGAGFGGAATIAVLPSLIRRIIHSSAASDCTN